MLVMVFTDDAHSHFTVTIEHILGTCPIVLYLIFTDYSSFIMIVVVHCNKYCIVLYCPVVTKSVQSQCIPSLRPSSACQEGSGHGDCWQDGIWSWRIWAETGTIVTIMTMKDDPAHQIELETNFCEVFTITEKAPTKRPSTCWKCLLALSHLRIYEDTKNK